MPSRTVARLILRENPLVYPNLEAARCAVRKVRGNHGKHNRHHDKDKTLQRPNGKAGAIVLPKGMRQGKRAIRIPAGKALVLSDIHCPYHDERAIEAAVKRGHAEVFEVPAELMPEPLLAA